MVVDLDAAIALIMIGTTHHENDGYLLSAMTCNVQPVSDPVVK